MEPFLISECIMEAFLGVSLRSVHHDRRACMWGLGRLLPAGFIRGAAYLAVFDDLADEGGKLLLVDACLAGGLCITIQPASSCRGTYTWSLRLPTSYRHMPHLTCVLRQSTAGFWPPGPHQSIPKSYTDHQPLPDCTGACSAAAHAEHDEVRYKKTF